MITPVRGFIGEEKAIHSGRLTFEIGKHRKRGALMRGRSESPISLGKVCARGSAGRRNSHY